MAKKPKKDELITLLQAAEIYGLSVSYLRELAQRGRMQAKKIGNLWLTTPKDVESYIKSREVRGVYRKDM